MAWLNCLSWVHMGDATWIPSCAEGTDSIGNQLYRKQTCLADQMRVDMVSDLPIVSSQSHYCLKDRHDYIYLDIMS
jgi:hypothetical protein